MTDSDRDQYAGYELPEQPIDVTGMRKPCGARRAGDR